MLYNCHKYSLVSNFLIQPTTRPIFYFTLKLNVHAHRQSVTADSRCSSLPFYSPRWANSCVEHKVEFHGVRQIVSSARRLHIVLAQRFLHIRLAEAVNLRNNNLHCETRSQNSFYSFKKSYRKFQLSLCNPSSQTVPTGH